MKFHPFSYRSLEELKQAAQELGIRLPLSSEWSLLRQPLSAGPLRLANRIAIQPMEGCDGTQDGRPSELTKRRYRRFACGGAGLIWFEATAIVQEGRANPRQLWLHEENLAAFQKFVADIKETCMKANGFEPVVIMQATHSGRYSKPHGTPEPLRMLGTFDWYGATECVGGRLYNFGGTTTFRGTSTASRGLRRFSPADYAPISVAIIPE